MMLSQLFFKASIFSASAMALFGCSIANESTSPREILSEFPVTEEGFAEGALESATADHSWRTVWYDEFSESELDRSKWTPEESCWGGGNNERQCYVDRVQNVEVKDGILRLKAFKGRHTGPLLPEYVRGAPGGTKWQEYTSGKISTRGLAAYKYGRFSAKIKISEGQGAWSAFWMMPENSVYGDWPLSGEIDIMEAVNQETPCEECPGGIERRTSGALHFGDQLPNNTYLFSKSENVGEVGPSSEWRVYTVEWAEGVLQWLVDDRVFMKLEAKDWYSKSPEAIGREFAPFDQPFYLMLNLGVGGRLAEESNNGGFDPATFPTELQVDWVRVEQCREDWQTGLSCLTEHDWQGTPQGPWEVQAR